ncbi:hypothetical protein ACFL6U_16905 [Planctomycetota bacterium]
MSEIESISTGSLNPVDYIELDRRFRELGDNIDPEQTALESYIRTLFDRNQGLSWSDLLESWLVVVLGEPGSGKTYEFKHKCKELQEAGEYAFFIRLDSLTNTRLEDILSPPTYLKFTNWQRSSAAATFFLDSVDEAKFPKVSDFYLALDRFREDLGARSLGRAKILFSSRISEWQPHVDRSQVLSRFSRALESDNTQKLSCSDKEKTILVVQIEPLNKERVDCYIRIRGITDSTDFLEGLDHQYLWEFARRPIDIVDLVDYWRTYGRFGSLSEIIEHSIASKLRASERDQGDPLSEKEAKEGAEILGATTVLCKCFNFKVPDEAFSTVNAIDTNHCLPQTWTANKRHAFLTRPIFDSASYGRIRFHTRRISEFLAAKWLIGRMNRGCPVRELDAIFFNHVDNRRILRPAMAPVIVWLCHGDKRWNSDIRGWVLESNPWIHLQYGDPNVLPLDYKRQILRTLVDLAKDRTWLLFDSSAEVLSRLADPNLADDISQIIHNDNVANDLRSEMIQLVRFGRLSGCLDSLLDLIESLETPDRLKQYAVAVIRDIGDESSRCRLNTIVDGWNKISDGLCARIFETLYPGVLDGHNLVTLLQKLNPIVTDRRDLIFSLTSHLESVMRPDDDASILKDLLELHKLSGWSWVIEIIPTVLVDLLRRNDLSSPEIESAANALLIIARLSLNGALRDDKLKDLDKVTMLHPSIRQCLLWKFVDQHRKSKSEEPRMWMEFPAYHHTVNPANADIDWLINDLKAQEDPRNRALAVRLIMEIWNQFGRSWKYRRQIRVCLCNDANLLSLYRRLEKDGRWIFFKRLWHRHIRNKWGSKWWWKHKQRNIKEYWQWLRGEWNLIRNIRTLRQGKHLNWLASLCDEAKETHNHNTLSVLSWETLRKKRGRWIANATKKGCKIFWRTFTPLLPHEKDEASTIQIGTIVGLTGIQADLDDGSLDYTVITTEEAELMVRYAANDIAGFPPWLQDLAKHKSEALKNVLHQCIENEWHTANDHKIQFGAMEDLVWHGEGITAYIRDKVLELLRLDDPANCSILRLALLILLGKAKPLINEITEIAGSRIPSLSWNSEVFPLWMAVWLQLDASPAIDRIERILPDTSNGNQIMVKICAILGADRLDHEPILNDPSYMSPQHCKRFIPLVYRHVKPPQDIRRANQGGFSPIDRDYAQMFRNALIERLVRYEDDQPIKALQGLLQVPETTHLRDSILRHIEQREIRDADHQSWTPRDLRVFMEEHEIDPKTDIDLFRIVCKRLADIKHDVESSDNSLREEIRKEDDETVLRRWLARKLNEQSRERYTVPQEEEIDQQKRPDLRIENPNTNPVSLEIKWAENWTLNELLERLENQLFGQYLRSHDCRFGIYLLAIIGRKQHWQHPQSKINFSFEQVVDVIKTRTKELVASSDYIQSVEVVTIDFCPPS